MKQLKELLKEKDEFLADYWYIKHYHDNTELNYKIFKAKAAYLLTDLDEQLIEKIFGHTFIALVDKLINAVDKKEEKQIIINDIKNNSDKIIEQKYSQFVIQQAHKRGDLKDAVKIILEINELLTLHKVCND